tara:strand:+ start:92 stop:1201 length:1110 start_codon:yes stop_codon:yes gene_type:complete
MKNYNINVFYFLIILFFTIIFLTNNFHNYKEILIFGGADGYSYYEISKYSPYKAEVEIQAIHSERFLIPYFLGFLKNLTNLDIIFLYRISTCVLIFLICLQTFKIIKLKEFDFSYNISIALFALIIFNPYITRFYIANPLIVNDLFFVYGSLIAINGIDKKSRKTLFTGLIIAAIARQSAVAILLSMILVNFSMKSDFISFKKILVSIFILVIIYTIGFIYSSLVPQEGTRANSYYITLFGLLTENKSFNEILIFFIWPFLSFGPLILFFLIFFKGFRIKKERLELSYFILFYCIFIIIQPILQGVGVSGKNIIRLTTFSFIPILILIFINFELRKKSKIKLIIFMTIISLWTCHPTFSKFSFFKNIIF